MHAKSERMRALDEELGDLKMRIIDKETTITLRMSALILSRSSLLLAVERAGALLDAAIALALTARQFGWNCPKIVDEPVIDASRVTHPLSQLVVEHFVANPVSSGGGCSRIKIVTGPNACGKSIYLKQEVGLSLLASSLSYWASKGEECCPHIFLSSHFHALPELITDERGIVSYHTMEVFRKRDKLNFQFRFVDGLVDSSFASYTALKMGIQEDVVDRANEDRACVNDGELRENQVDLKWDYTVLHLRRETTMLPGKEKSALNEELSGSSHTLLSALRSEGRKTDRR
ncbi:MutS domain V protein [Necator americanus]|uniref:MutS domain V protein n=1 Tax=Necator americanus TaxID=51031 RepID=W2TY93_NECAM|nr:MutS domain V protein [Necator americanus]ETN86021.1 MutS domain V protein [Necator americanus]